MYQPEVPAAGDEAITWQTCQTLAQGDVLVLQLSHRTDARRVQMPSVDVNLVSTSPAHTPLSFEVEYDDPGQDIDVDYKGSESSIDESDGG